METSYSPSMKNGSGRSMTMIKKKKKNRKFACNEKNIVLLFTQPLMCAVLSLWGEELSSSHMYLWCSRLLPSVCLSKKLYIFNWLRLPHGSKASSLVCVWFIFSQQVSSIGWVVPFQNSLTVTKTASMNQEESTETAEMNAHAIASRWSTDYTALLPLEPFHSSFDQNSSQNELSAHLNRSNHCCYRAHFKLEISITFWFLFAEKEANEWCCFQIMFFFPHTHFSWVGGGKLGIRWF